LVVGGAVGNPFFNVFLGFRFQLFVGVVECSVLGKLGQSVSGAEDAIEIGFHVVWVMEHGYLVVGVSGVPYLE